MRAVCGAVVIFDAGGGDKGTGYVTGVCGAVNPKDRTRKRFINIENSQEHDPEIILVDAAGGRDPQSIASPRKK